MKQISDMYFKHERIILLTSIFILISLLSFISIYKFTNNQEEIKQVRTDNIIQTNDNQEEVENKETIKETIFVDVKGEINNPGVYEVNKGERVIDIVYLAGGFTEKADTSNVNLSKILNDQNVVLIPKQKKTDVNETNNNIINDALIKEEDETASEEKQLVNINTATKEELMTLDGIGESKAITIIQYRENNNGFKRLEELMEVKGIGESLYEKIKENITI